MTLKDKLESHPIYIFILGSITAVGLLLAINQLSQRDVGGVAASSESPEDADVIETELPKFTVACSGAEKLCDDYLDVNIETRAKLGFRYYVGKVQCSSIRLHVFLDGTEVKRTEFMGWHGAPGKSANLLLETGLIDLSPVSSGNHNVRLQAEGQPSGCSKDGHIRGWGGAVRLFTSPPRSGKGT